MAYDLADYICPANGKPFKLSSNESCQSIKAADGWIEFRKNRHMEEFRVTPTAIQRGADTSLISKDGIDPVGTFYIQYAGSKEHPIYGCDWVARYMSEGQVFHRSCLVNVYDYTGKLLTSDVVDSDIVLRKHHNSLLLPSGITVNDVLEFQWGGNEIYFYAKGYGLVGWRYLLDGSFGNFLVQFSGNIQQPFPHAIARPNVASAPTNPPAPQAPNRDDLGSIITSRTPSSGPINCRDFPSTATGKIITQVKANDVIKHRQTKTVKLNGYTWWAVEEVNGKPMQGWIASEVITLIEVQDQKKVILDLGFVYVSQVDLAASLRDNDCGLASGISASRTRLKKTGYGDIPLLTVNNLVPFSSLKNSDGPISMPSLELFMRLLGIPFTYSDQLTPAAIKLNLQAGNGILSLMNYVYLNSKHRFGHYANIVGLAEYDTFIINDSYLMGEGFQMSASRLNAALTDLVSANGSRFASKPYQGYILNLK